MEYIYKLTEKPSLDLVGAKAFNLCRLAQYGQKIPLSFFISVTALKEFIKENNLIERLNDLKKIIQTSASLNDCEKEAKSFRDLILSGNISDSFKDELIDKVIGSFKDPNIKVAVRSSSINEDLEHHSFAGQYESNLNVTLSIDDLIKNIKSVWASQWSEQIIAYTFKHSLQVPEPGMGVILQEMVEAEIAGVLFSQNPYSFDKDEMIVEYVDGLGEALVSGEKTPVHLVFDRKAKRFKKVENEVKQKYGKPLNELINIAYILEQKTNSAVDIEWALAEKKLLLLQMRSITTSGENVVLWTDENVGEVIPDIVTPFSWSILNPITNNAFKRFLNGLSIKDYPAEGLFGLFKGKVFFNNTAFHKTLERFYITTYFNAIKGSIENKLVSVLKLILLPLKLTWALYSFLRFSSILPKKIVQHFDVHKLSLESNKYKKDMSEHISYDHINQIIVLHNQTMFLHLSGTIMAELYYQFFKKVCEKWISKKTGLNADQLLTGLDAAESAKSGEALWKLSNIIRQKKLAVSFNRNDVSAIEKDLKKTVDGIAVLKEIENFIDQFGHSALHEFELLYPRWWEDRSYIYSNIGNYLNNDFIDLTAEKKVRIEKHDKNVLTAESSVSVIKRWIFKYLYKKASFFSSQRENLKQAFIKAHSELKKHLLNIGEILMSAGKLSRKDDILFFENKEIDNVINNNLQISFIKTDLEIRRKQRLKYNSEKHPQRIVQIGKTWYPVFNDSETTEGVIRGIGCSSGVVEGTAKVITNENQFNNLKEGDILVTKSTNPGWTPLFVIAAGVVTEIGGALSHGAIIAREYGIPMISAVKDITQTIKSGDVIRINGDLGTVEIIENKGTK